jgi:hypothetical protein
VDRRAGRVDTDGTLTPVSASGEGQEGAPRFLSEEEMRILRAVCDRLVPEDDTPGASQLGAPEYIDGLLGAFLVDPPRVWAGGPTSGRHGGRAAFGTFHRLSALDELAWRTRIEGSRGIPEREFNGPVEGLQETYRAGLSRLGTAFLSLAPDEQDERLRAERGFAALVYEHCCEGLYGAPEYGGNPGAAVWAAIDYPGDVQPRGYADDEVAGP